VTAAKNPGAVVAALGAIEADDLGRRVSSIINPTSKLTQALRAELIGPDRCTALGITASGHAPVLALCRLLIVAGHPPATPLQVYRGETLALRVRSVGEGACLAIEDDRHGRPRFRRSRKEVGRYGAASPVCLNTAGVVNSGPGVIERRRGVR